MRPGQRVLLPSGTRSADTQTALQRNAGYRGVRLYLRISAASGTGGLKVIVRGHDPASGLKAELNSGGTAKTAAGLYVYELYPDAASAAGDVADAVSRQLPAEWDALVKHGDSSNYTYSLGCEYLP